MRILHVSSWFQPVLGYSEYHLPTALQRLGHTVAVLTSDRHFPFPDYPATVEPVLGRRIVGPGKRVEEGLLTYRLPITFEYRHHLWLRHFDAAVRDFSPDVLHVYQAFTLPTVQSALAKSRYNYGLVVGSSMEKEVFRPQSLLRRAYYRLYATGAGPLLRRSVDTFTAVGEGARDIVSEVIGLPREVITIFPLGADSERFRFDLAARREIRRSLGVPDDLPLAVYAGKLIPRKDVHVLLESLKHLDRVAGMGVLLLGNGAPEYEAQLRAIAAHATHPVFYRRAVPNKELARYFSAGDIGVWPSESSNAAIEAALVGLPVVLSLSDATRHYIAGENGLAFPRGDALSLARCLQRLVTSAQLRKEMGARGREYATKHLSWAAGAQRAVALYEAVIASRVAVRAAKTPAHGGGVR